MFIFHVSNLSEGPILFFGFLEQKYLPLLRKAYLRTGFNVDTYRSQGRWPVGQMGMKSEQDLSTSVQLIRKAWLGVFVDRDKIFKLEAEDDARLLRRQDVNDWPKSGYHLWKMILINAGNGVLSREFRRVDW